MSYEDLIPKKAESGGYDDLIPQDRAKAPASAVKICSLVWGRGGV